MVFIFGDKYLDVSLVIGQTLVTLITYFFKKGRNNIRLQMLRTNNNKNNVISISFKDFFTFNFIVQYFKGVVIKDARYSNIGVH